MCDSDQTVILYKYVLKRTFMYGSLYENDSQVNVNVCWEKKFKFLNSVENLVN